MTIDDAKIIHDLLDTYWNSSNVARPVIYYTDDVKYHDGRVDAIKIYPRSLTRRIADVTYSYHEIRTGISIDIRCSNRDRMLKIRDEVNRCLNNVRRAPDSNYNLLLFDGERQVTGYSGFYHYVIDITLKNNGKLIPT